MGRRHSQGNSISIYIAIYAGSLRNFSRPSGQFRTAQNRCKGQKGCVVRSGIITNAVGIFLMRLRPQGDSRHESCCDGGSEIFFFSGKKAVFQEEVNWLSIYLGKDYSQNDG